MTKPTRYVAAFATLFVCSAAAQAQRPRTSPSPVSSTQSVAPAYDTLLYNAMHFRMIGPFRGGRSTAVTGVADQPYLFYMGSTGGGVWRTEDAGQHWDNISDGSFGGSIGAVDVADSDPNVIYVGTGSGDIRGNTSAGRGIWKSTDAGKTWTFSGLAESGAIRRLAVHPSNPEVAWAAVVGHPFGPNPERGVYRTTNGGKTWDRVLFLNDSTGASDIAVNWINPRILYAAMWRAERKPYSMLSGSRAGGIWKSVDGGDTWVKLTGGLPDGMTGKIGVTVSRANPERVWAIVEAEPDGGVYRSDDAGKTWTRTNSENKLRQRAWYYTRIEADPADENTVYALNTSIYRSVDAGKTFEAIDVPHGDTHDLWINPRDHRFLILGDDGGAQVSLTRGKTWSTMNNQPTAEFYDVVVDNQFPYRVYSSQQDNTSISVPSWTGPNSLHPTQQWRYASGCETGPVALHPDHPEVIYGGCYGGAINRMDTRTDERRDVILYPQLQLGQAAKDLKYRFQWVAPILVSKHDPNVVYHGSQYVHRTRDGGMTWETISPDLTTNHRPFQEYSGGPINHDVTGVEIYTTLFAISEDPKDARTLWTGSDDGKVHITRNAGATWEDITPKDMPQYATVENIELSTHADGRAYLAAQKYRFDDFRPYIWRTDDYGKTWTLLTDGVSGIPKGSPVRSVREDPAKDGVVYAGTEYGLFVSFNGGSSWQSLQLNLPISPVADMRVHDNDLVVATQGRALWILDDLTPLHQLADVAANAPAHLYRPRDAYRVDLGEGGAGGVEVRPENRPDGVVLTYYLNVSNADAKLEVLDGQGRAVRTFTPDTSAARKANVKALPVARGMNRYVWDLTYPGPEQVKGQVIWGYFAGVKAPPGSYQVRLTANGVTQTRPFRILGDPRLTTVAQADYEEQFKLAVTLRDSINSVNRSIEIARAVKEQATRALEQAGRVGRDAEVKPATDSLNAKLSTVEGEMLQVKSESGQDPIRHAGKIDNNLAEIYGNVTGVDGYIHGGPEGRPSRGAYERMADVLKEWTPVSQRLQLILDKDVPAFNELLRRLGLGAIVVPRKTVM
ncbi:MAG: glycosyl hydrolase [Gemmatimonadaceae bacterium]